MAGEACERRHRDARVAAAAVADVMEPGPTTIRASEHLHDDVERMHRARVDRLLVTTPAGRLLGLLRLEDAERALRQPAGAGRQRINPS